MPESPKNKNLEPQQGKRRSVRLKEHGRDAVRLMTPSESYLTFTDGSLSTEDCLLRTDENGWIVNLSHNKSMDAPVYVLGDSFVESSFIQEGKRFTDIMTKKFSTTENPRTVVNGGYSGATTLHMFNTLVNKVQPNERASIIHILPSNDTLSLLQGRGFWNFSDQRYTPLLPIDGKETVAADIRENLLQLEGVLKALAAWTNTFSMDLYLATTPYVQTNYEDLPWFIKRYKTPAAYEKLKANRRLSNEVVRNVCKKMRVRLVDLEVLLKDNQFFYDDVHLNELGSARTARIFELQIGTVLTE